MVKEIDVFVLLLVESDVAVLLKENYTPYVQDCGVLGSYIYIWTLFLFLCFVESPSNESDSASNSSVDATAPLMRQRISNISSHSENEGYVSSTVERPAIPGSLVQPATTVLTQQQPTEIVTHAFGTNLWKFDKLPYEMYNKICRRFDKNIPGISSDDLACWLELTAGEVSRIENEKSKTHAIIEIWTEKDENHDVKSFIKILEDKKVARNLAGEISKCAEQVYK